MPTRPDGRRCADCCVTHRGHREVYGRGLLTYQARTGRVFLCCACHKGRLARAAAPRSCRFLHGPYSVPTLGEGDQAFCAYRGCSVVVTGFSGTATWPRGKPAGRSGRPSPVVTPELTKAIREESPRALCTWLGVSVALVRSWRIALGCRARRAV
jgi:hypothetical protein